MNQLLKKSLVGILFVCLVVACAGSHAFAAQYSVTFSYDPAFVDGPDIVDWKGVRVTKFETATAWIKIPDTVKKGDVIRGVMSKVGGLINFAERNKIAIYGGGPVSTPYGGPHKTFLKEAAKVTGHPELEHAGVILQGTSNRGRFAAHFAHFWSDRVIAVLLDQSWTTGKPCATKEFNYARLPYAAGVPFFFKASQKDTQGGFDRRSLHYKWCTAAFSANKQPCTSVISIHDVKHGRVSTRQLQAIWLEEVMNLRVPAVIPADGTPYKLIPVNPHKVGGYVTATKSKNDDSTIHTDVKVEPVGGKKRASWWIPGPRSAAMYLEWVRINHGKVSADKSAEIINMPTFKKLKGALAKAEAALIKKQYGRALQAISDHEVIAKVKPDAKANSKYNQAALKILKELATSAVEKEMTQLAHLREIGALVELKELHKKTNLKGVEAFTKLEPEIIAALKAPDASATLSAGRSFHSLWKKMNKKRSQTVVTGFQKLYTKCPDNFYGKVAKLVYKVLSNDANAPLFFNNYLKEGALDAAEN